MANRSGYGATPPVTETCLSLLIQIDAADGYKGIGRRKGRQILKRKTDLKCALAMVASEARLVVNDTVCCQLLHQIQSYRTPYTSAVCRQMTPSLHTPFFAQKTSAKEKKKVKSTVQSLPFLLLLLSLHNRSNNSNTGATRRLSDSRGGRRAQSQKCRSSATRKPLEHDKLQAQSARLSSHKKPAPKKKRK